MELVDTHAHVFDEQFNDDLAEVLERAAAAGVVRIVAVGIDAESNRRSLALAEQFPILRPAIGIQPNHVAEAAPGDWDEVVRIATTTPHVVAIGETGLDRYWDRAPFTLQEEYFARHLELARRTNRPFIVHCREAETDVVRMLRADFERHGPLRGVMHSFTGDAATARDCLAMGMHVSFAGMVTYKSAGDLRAVAATIPDERILIETDCPYLAPMPYRGRRNEPAFVVETARILARERGVPLEALARQSTANARDLFPGL